MASTSGPPADEFSAMFTYISQLQLHDIDDFQSRANANAPLSDEELAMMLFAEEAEGLLNITKDYLSGSPRDARVLMEELAAMEEMARLDREMAIALSEGREPPARPPVRAPGPAPGTAAGTSFTGGSASRGEQRPPPVAVTFPEDDDYDYAPNESDSGGSSASEHDIDTPISPAPSPIFEPANNGKAIDVRPPENCTVCGDVVDGSAIYAPCGHAYDAACLDDMFSIASVDESLYPPRCCQMTIPFDDVRQHLSSSIASTFLQKSAEFDTKDRVYCHVPTCSAFVGAATSEVTVLACPTCGESTCSSCKEEAHALRPCSIHLDEAVLQLAKEKEWQRCSECHRLVELSYGCFHMQCLCKHQFCYLCGVPWKTCACPQFAVERL